MTWPFRRRRPSIRTLLLQLIEETKHMNQQIADLKAESDAFRAAVEAYIASNTAAIASLQAKIDQLIANGAITAEDAATLTQIAADMKAEQDKVTGLTTSSAPVAG